MSAPSTSLEKLAFLFHDHLLAFKARERALPLVEARFEFMIPRVTDLVTIEVETSIFWTDFTARLKFKAPPFGRG
jgi:hypothetical protein